MTTKIYLAGGRNSHWRTQVQQVWKDKAEGIDPFTLAQGAVHLFTHGDLEAVRECDILFGYNDYSKYTGMALEFGYAHALGKPIIYVPALPRVDSMMAGVSTAIFTEVLSAAEFVLERFL